jgi:hypothetical protein
LFGEPTCRAGYDCAQEDRNMLASGEKQRIDEQLERLAEATADAARVRQLWKGVRADGPYKYFAACLDAARPVLASAAAVRGQRTWVEPLLSRPRTIMVVGGPDELGGDEHDGTTVLFADDYPAKAHSLLEGGVCVAVRPTAVKKSKLQEILCVVRTKPNTTPRVYEIDSRDVRDRGDVIEFVRAEVDGIHGTVAPTKAARPNARIKVEKPTGDAPATDALAKVVLGEETLQGLVPGRAQSSWKGWKGSAGFKDRKDADGVWERETKAVVEKGVVNRIDTFVTVRASNLTVIGRDAARAIVAELERRHGKPKGKENKDGSGEWNWATGAAYVRCRSLPRKLDKGSAKELTWLLHVFYQQR